MKKYLFSLAIALGLFTCTANCQVEKKDVSQQLEELFDRLVNNFDDSQRLLLNDSIRIILDSYVRSDSVFTHRFTNLRYLGQIESPDSMLKIITWNLVLENEPGRYFCYFIRKMKPGQENRVYRLSTKYSETPVRIDTTYSESDWYGALYYNLRPFGTGDDRCWVMLGIDYGNAYITRKIIEVLSFLKDGSIVFGKKWFSADRELKYREVFEYASNAMMSLRFRSDSSIVFDHLAPFSSSHKGDREYYGPDYSFDAYNFENGIWSLKINVDVRNNE